MSKTFSSLSGRRQRAAERYTQLELPFDAPAPAAGPEPPTPIQPDLAIPARPAPPIPAPASGPTKAQADNATQQRSTEYASEPATIPTGPAPSDAGKEIKVSEKPKGDIFAVKAMRQEEELSREIEALRKEKENLLGQIGKMGQPREASKDGPPKPEASGKMGSARRESGVPRRAPRQRDFSAPPGRTGLVSSQTPPPAQPSEPRARKEPFSRHLTIGQPETFSETGRFPQIAVIGIALVIGALVIGAGTLFSFMRPAARAKTDTPQTSARSASNPALKPAAPTPAPGPAADLKSGALPAQNSAASGHPGRPAATPPKAPAPEPGKRSAAAPKPPVPAAWPEIAGPGVRVTAATNELLVVFSQSVFSARAEFSDEGRKLLLKVAETCSGQAADFLFVFQGHTDPGRITSGVFSDNRALAQARADAAVALWRSHANIPASNMNAVSKGEDDPPYPNNTPEMRRRNRTVTIRILRK